MLARFVRNRRLADALTLWAFCSLTASPGARAFYDRHRSNGDSHYQALRALANRWVGILHGWLRHHTKSAVCELPDAIPPAPTTNTKADPEVLRRRVRHAIDDLEAQRAPRQPKREGGSDAP